MWWQFVDFKAKVQAEGLLSDKSAMAKLDKFMNRFCMMVSRLYVQVIQFIDEANFFKG